MRRSVVKFKGIEVFHSIKRMLRKPHKVVCRGESGVVLV